MCGSCCERMTAFHAPAMIFRARSLILVLHMNHDVLRDDDVMHPILSQLSKMTGFGKDMLNQPHGFRSGFQNIINRSKTLRPSMMGLISRVSFRLLRKKGESLYPIFFIEGIDFYSRHTVLTLTSELWIYKYNSQGEATRLLSYRRWYFLPTVTRWGPYLICHG